VKNKLQLLLVTVMTAAACNALAATSVESDVRINSSPKTGTVEKIQQTNPYTQPINPSTANNQPSPERIVAPPKETSPQWKTIKGVDYRGKFELAQGDQCVRVLADNTLRMQPCRSGGVINWAFWVLRNGGIGRANWAKSCLWAPNVFAGDPKDKKVTVGTCPDGMQALLLGSNRTLWRVYWTLLADGRVVLMSGLETDGKNLRYSHLQSQTPQCLEYSPHQSRVIVAPCAYKKPTQTWKPFTEHVKG